MIRYLRRSAKWAQSEPLCGPICPLGHAYQVLAPVTAVTVRQRGRFEIPIRFRNRGLARPAVHGSFRNVILDVAQRLPVAQFRSDICASRDFHYSSPRCAAKRTLTAFGPPSRRPTFSFGTASLPNTTNGLRSGGTGRVAVYDRHLGPTWVHLPLSQTPTHSCQPRRHLRPSDHLAEGLWDVPGVVVMTVPGGSWTTIVCHDCLPMS
jgi:hypothetical protein